MSNNEDWVIDTNYLVIANCKKPNIECMTFQSFLDAFKNKKISLVMTPKIYVEYEKRALGKGDNWVSDWHNSIFDRIKFVPGKLPKRHVEALKKMRFHYNDQKFITASYLSNKKRLSTTDEDFSQTRNIKNYLRSKLEINILTFSESIDELDKV